MKVSTSLSVTANEKNLPPPLLPRDGLEQIEPQRELGRKSFPQMPQFLSKMFGNKAGLWPARSDSRSANSSGRWGVCKQ